KTEPSFISSEPTPIEHSMNLLEPAEADPHRIPGYDIDEMIGEDGMSSLYLARRKRDGVKVVVNMMLPQLTVSSYIQHMYQRAIKIHYSLQHPNIVELLDQGSMGDILYFVMEYC